MRDGTRTAELLSYGKLPESFIPPQWQRELRDLTRLRARLTQEVTRAGNRILKVLEDAQIKLDCVATDAWGVSGRRILNNYRLKPVDSYTTESRCAAEAA
jgi:hypothetical protein